MKQKEIINGVKSLFCKDKEQWHNWLNENYELENSVWLIMNKKKTKIPSINYNEALEEALCFGWIDTKKKSRDKDSYYHLFSQRKSKSYWSRSNKLKIDKLIAENRMQTSGIAKNEYAKQTGTWDALNGVENLIFPVDLETEFLQYKFARENWDGFSEAKQKSILLWIFLAKRVETRTKRIEETARLAHQNIKENQ